MRVVLRNTTRQPTSHLPYSVVPRERGASIRALRAHAGVSDGQLGTALLLVGAGALPAMLLTGRLIDRSVRRATALLLILLCTVGLLVVVVARDLTSLALALEGLGASSGAADVGINPLARSAQEATRRPITPRAHAAFSAAVVAVSLLTGALLALGAPLVTPFALLVPAAAISAAAREDATTERRCFFGPPAGAFAVCRLTRVECPRILSGRGSASYGEPGRVDG